MKCLSLLTFVAAVQGFFSLDVTIHYDHPLLSFTLPVLESDVASVTFHHVIDGTEYSGTGTQGKLGWRYETRDATLDKAGSVSAYAILYDINGEHRLTSQRASLVLKDSSIARLPPRRLRGAVIFRDDFNFFDTTKWKYEVSVFAGHHHEFEVYTNEQKNVFTKDGKLHIQPTLTIDDPRFDNYTLYHGTMNVTELFGYCTKTKVSECVSHAGRNILPPIMSGMVKSVPTLRYGIVEIRAKIPKGDWLWPAMWMMPRHSVYGGWPRSGEIDIMESKGNTDPKIGVDRVTTTDIWGISWRRKDTRAIQRPKFSSNFSTEFHVWRLEWTPEYMNCYIDDEKFFHVGPDFYKQGHFHGKNIWAKGEPMAPFDREFYMIFNVAIGGTNGFFPEHYPWIHKKPWSNKSPVAAKQFWNGRDVWYKTWQGNSALEIDYVEFRHL